MNLNDAFTQQRRSRREILRGGIALAGAGALGPTLGRVAHAQDSTTAGGDLSGLGLPEIKVTATDTGYQGIPDSLTAGRYLVTITNAVSSGTTDSTVASFVMLPEGVTFADVTAMLGGSGVAATPGASPEAGGGEDQAPAWYYTTTLAGGPSAAPGQSVSGVIDLTAGNWMIWAEDTSAPQMPSPLIVTGDAPANAPTPPANVTFTEVNMGDGFMFQVDGALAHGKQTIKIVNASDQPHFVVLAGSPVPLTMDQVQAILTMPDGATPEPGSGLPDPAAIVTGAYAGTQSPGVTQWIEADLDKDTYILACFIGDPKKGGIPHAFEGMIDILTVGVAATPTS